MKRFSHRQGTFRALLAGLTIALVASSFSTAVLAQRRPESAQQCMYSTGNVVSNYPHPGYYYPPPPNAPPPSGTR